MSCSNDDDSSNDNVSISDNIIGEWQLNRRESGGSLESVEVCELLTTISFTENDNFDVELFIGDDLDECQSASTTGIWEYLGGDKISIFLDGQNQPAIYGVSISGDLRTLTLIETFGDERLEEYVR